MESAEGRKALYNVIVQGQIKGRGISSTNLLDWIAFNQHIQRFKVESYLINPDQTRYNKREFYVNETKTDSQSFNNDSNQNNTQAMNPNNQEITTLYAVAKSELHYLKDSHNKLEHQVEELKSENYKLKNENFDLNLQVKTAEREKKLEITQAKIEAKPTGLGALTEPDMINNLGDLAFKIISAYKGQGLNSPNNNSANGNDMSVIKSEALSFFKEQLHRISEDQANQLIWLIKTMIDQSLIEDTFKKWSINIADSNQL